MSLTRAVAEGMILQRCQAILSESLGAATIPALPASVPSPNAFLGWSVAAALLDCRITPADPSNPTDAECSAVAGPIVPKYWDCAEYHALSAALNQFLQVSNSAGEVSSSDSDLGQRLQFLVKMKAEQIKERYGVGVFANNFGTIAVGQIPPYTARPHIPQSQNWPPGGFGGGYGYGSGYGGYYGY